MPEGLQESADIPEVRGIGHMDMSLEEVDTQPELTNKDRPITCSCQGRGEEALNVRLQSLVFY